MKPLTLQEIVQSIRGRPAGVLPKMSICRISTDSRSVTPADLFFAIKGPNFDGHDFVPDALEKGAAAAVISHEGAQKVPDVQGQPIIQVPDTIAALGAMAKFYRGQLAAQVIAVTGSNGKTTTKDMIHHVLGGRFKGSASPASFNNHIGVPKTLLAAGGADEYLIVEIGSNAPGEINSLAALVQPDVAVITSIGVSHLQGLGDVIGVAQEKASILAHVPRGGLGIVCSDSAELERLLPRSPEFTLLRFGTEEDTDVRLTDLVLSADACDFRINGRFEMHLPVPGRHNALNAVAAAAVARRFGMEYDEIAERLNTFASAPMRSEFIKAGRVRIINDAYNANPTSARAALEVLSAQSGRARKVLIMGDMLELGPDAKKHHRSLGEEIARHRFDLLMAVGRFSNDLVRAAAKNAPAGQLAIRFATTADLAKNVAKHIYPTDIILIKGSRAMQLETVAETIVDAAKRRKLQKPKTVKAKAPKTSKKNVA